MSSCVTNGKPAHAVAGEECNIENYKDFIKEDGIHKCNLRGADLTREILNFANLSQADLRNAKVTNAMFHKADLSKADIRGANFEEAYNLSGVNLNGTKVTQKQADYLKSEGHSGFVVVE